MPFYYTCELQHNKIIMRASEASRIKFFIRGWNTANLINCISLSSRHSHMDLHKTNFHGNNGQHVPARITSRNDHRSTKGSGSTANVININIVKKMSQHAPQLCFATWSIRSINKKAVSSSDFTISKGIDVLAVLKMWLTKTAFTLGRIMFKLIAFETCLTKTSVHT